MFREMRRGRQALSEDACGEILARGTSGVLAVRGDEGWPYAVPLSYVYSAGRVWFHCAPAGHKLDALRREEKASFCVIDRDEIVKEKFTTYFRSVILFGRVRVLEDDAEKRAALEAIAAKYGPDDPAARAQEIESTWARVCLLEMHVEHMSGKEIQER